MTSGEGRPAGRQRLSLWIKLLYTAWVVVLVPIWIRWQGPQNFLWFSDIALLLTCAALWFESRFLASMTAVGIILPDLAWAAHFLVDLVVDAGPFERSGYMFNEDLPLFVRALSLYHIIILPLLIWMVARLGYDRRALLAQTLLAWAVLLFTYLVTDPSDNINFVFGLGDPPRTPLPQPLWLILQMALLPVCVYLPTHLFLARWAVPRQT